MSDTIFNISMLIILILIFVIYYKCKPYRNIITDYGLCGDTIISTEVLYSNIKERNIHNYIITAYNLKYISLINYVSYLKTINSCRFADADYEFTVLIKYRKGIFKRESNIGILQHFVCRNGIVSIKYIEHISINQYKNACRH